MISFQIDGTVDRPIEEVFERLVDIDDYRNWMDRSWLFMDTGQVSEGPVDQGTEFYDKTILGTLPGSVIHFERPTTVVFRQVLEFGKTIAFESRPGYVLEPVDGATVVHHIAEGELFGLYKFLEPIVQVLARVERRRTMRELMRSFAP